ncbi:uncharacterized protein LOC126594537 isoform X2 [Malus sylvestris]|uniref:uncharacterized protein LOC126594537 isoform X2 n=1 Tax=Malus sylvestris TaxID=3752 RepID=UPI0021AC7907|nr:uncharacterized protein LOC126594537 isoform X2 [Malus sylvestris]
MLKSLIFILRTLCLRCHLASFVLNLCAPYQWTWIGRFLMRRLYSFFDPRSNKFDKALSKEGSARAPIFDNMRNLSIHCENLNDDLVPGMVSLLRVMPNLNILYVKTSPRPFLFTPKTSTGFGLDYWKMQNLAFVDQLKEVTIEHSHGSNEIEFARYILEHAQNLKKMIIALYNEDAQSQVVAEMVLPRCIVARPLPISRIAPFRTIGLHCGIRTDSYTTSDSDSKA